MATINTETKDLPGFIERGQYNRSELYGFEVDMSGRILVPEFPPRTPDELSAQMPLESELQVAIQSAA